MKATINKKHAGKIAAVFCAAFVITTGIWAQPNPDVYKNSIDESFGRMESLIDRTEQALKYVAPSVKDQEEEYRTQQNVTGEELSECINRLELLASKTEKVLKYEAPSVADDDINSAFERREMLANNIGDQVHGFR